VARGGEARRRSLTIRNCSGYSPAHARVPVEVLAKVLVQLRIFRVDAGHIRAMQARGLEDLTIEKLVRMKIAGID
jgi:hypothetical protein